MKIKMQMNLGQKSLKKMQVVMTLAKNHGMSITLV